MKQITQEQARELLAALRELHEAVTHPEYAREGLCDRVDTLLDSLKDIELEGEKKPRSFKCYCGHDQTSHSAQECSQCGCTDYREIPLSTPQPAPQEEQWEEFDCQDVNPLSVRKIIRLKRRVN